MNVEVFMSVEDASQPINLHPESINLCQKLKATTIYSSFYCQQTHKPGAVKRFVRVWHSIIAVDTLNLHTHTHGILFKL